MHEGISPSHINKTPCPQSISSKNHWPHPFPFLGFASRGQQKSHCHLKKAKAKVKVTTTNHQKLTKPLERWHKQNIRKPMGKNHPPPKEKKNTPPPKKKKKTKTTPRNLEKKHKKPGFLCPYHRPCPLDNLLCQDLDFLRKFWHEICLDRSDPKTDLKQATLCFGKAQTPSFSFLRLNPLPQKKNLFLLQVILGAMGCPGY